MRALVLLTLLAFAAAFPTTTTAAPNVLLIYVDDLGYGDLGSYGHPIIQTPNLDQLATEGVRLTNYYAPSALCSPSRASLLTGRHPYRTGIKSWIPHGSGVFLHDEEVTLAEILRDQGYRTALIGKWHLNSSLDTTTAAREGLTQESQPMDQGFDYAFGHNAFQIPTNRNPTNIFRNGEPVGQLEGYTAELYADEAMQWMEQGEEPFFLFLSMAEPHTTIENPPDYNAMYTDHTRGVIKPIPSGLPNPPKDLLVARGPGEYFANITYLDAQLGRVFSHLRKIGQQDNTIIVFASDNGPVTDDWINWYEVNSYGDTGGLRGRKHYLYEGGIKVPAIVKAPALVPAGTTSDAFIVGTDWFRTIAHWTGAIVPDAPAIDGIDVSRALATGADTPARPVLWALDSVSELEFAYREGNWKLMLDRQHRPAVLYDLQTDPLELFDRLASEPEIVANMTSGFQKMFTAIQSDPLRPLPTTSPD